MVPKTEVGSAHTREWINPKVPVHIDSERNDTVGGIYHTGWVMSKSFILKRTETQKGMTGVNESLAAVRNHSPRFLI